MSIGKIGRVVVAQPLIQASAKKKKGLRRTLRGLAKIGLAVSLAVYGLTIVSPIQDVKAGTITGTYTLGSTTTGATTSHFAELTFPSGLGDTNYVVLEMGSQGFTFGGFDLNNFNLQVLMDGPDPGTGCNVGDTWTDVTEDPAASGWVNWEIGEWYDPYPTVVGYYISAPEIGWPNQLAAGCSLRVYAGSNSGKGGAADFITNPGSAGLKTITLTTAFGSDSGTVNVTIDSGAPPPSYLLTTTQDELSTLTASANANHEVKFSTLSGAAESTDTITLAFQTGFSGVSAIDYSDIDIAQSNQSSCTGGTFTERSVSASGPPGSNVWGVSSSGQTVTLTHPTNNGSAQGIETDRCVRIRIGTNAVTGVTGDEQIQNPTAGNYTVTIGGTFNSNGTALVSIIANSSVDVTASVPQTLSFSITDNTIGFGTLSASSSRYATGDTNGLGSETVAHTLVAATNATSGYGITIFGPTLTSGAYTITNIGATAAAPSIGSEQFGLRATASGGGGSVSSPYNSGDYAYNGTGSPVRLASASTPSTATTYSLYYLANIGPATEPGVYATALTYTCTGVF